MNVTMENTTKGEETKQQTTETNGEIKEETPEINKKKKWETLSLKERNEIIKNESRNVFRLQKGEQMKQTERSKNRMSGGDEEEPWLYEMGICKQTPVGCFPKNAGRHKKRNGKGPTKFRDAWSEIGDFLREQHLKMGLPQPMGRKATNLQSIFNDIKEKNFEGSDIPSGVTNDDIIWKPIGKIYNLEEKFFPPMLKKLETAHRWSIGKYVEKKERTEYFIYDEEGRATKLLDAEFFCDKTEAEKQEDEDDEEYFKSSAEEVVYLKEKLKKMEINNYELKKENRKLEATIEYMYTEEEYSDLFKRISNLKKTIKQNGINWDDY